MENNGSVSAEGNSEDCEVVIVDGENEELEEEEDEMGLYLKEGEYNVEKLLDMKIEKGKKKFLVKWQGYPNSQNTWEPIDHLTSIPTMVEEFEKEYQRKKQLRNQEPQAKKTVNNIHPPEPKSLKRFATANLTNETITKKIKGNPQNEVAEEEYHAEESSPAGDQSPIVEIAEDEEEKMESKSASSRPNQRKASKPPIKAVKDLAQKKMKDKMGSFKQKDKPLCIKGVKPGRNNEFYFIVEWEKRSDGTKPENSHVSNEQLKISAPRFLFEFYESKLVIFSRKKLQNVGAQSPVQNPGENEEGKEDIENRGAFDNPLDSKKFSDKNNHQILEEMRRELDSHQMNEDDDDNASEDFPNTFAQNNCL